MFSGFEKVRGKLGVAFRASPFVPFRNGRCRDVRQFRIEGVAFAAKDHWVNAVSALEWEWVCVTATRKSRRIKRLLDHPRRSMLRVGHGFQSENGWINPVRGFQFQKQSKHGSRTWVQSLVRRVSSCSPTEEIRIITIARFSSVEVKSLGRPSRELPLRPGKKAIRSSFSVSW